MVPDIRSALVLEVLAKERDRRKPLFLPGPGQVAGGIGANAPQLVAGCDVECFAISTTKSTVGNHVDGNGDKLDKLPCLRNDINTRFVFLDRFTRGLGEVEPGGDIEVSLLVDSHAIRTSIAAPVE